MFLSPHVFSSEVLGIFLTSPFLPFFTVLYFFIRALCVILPCQKDHANNLFDKKKPVFEYLNINRKGSRLYIPLHL